MSPKIPPNSWFKYINYTDHILRNKNINPITLSNPFLHPIKPEYKVLKDLDYLLIVSLVRLDHSDNTNKSEPKIMKLYPFFKASLIFFSEGIDI